MRIKIDYIKPGERFILPPENIVMTTREHIYEREDYGLDTERMACVFDVTSHRAVCYFHFGTEVVLI